MAQVQVRRPASPSTSHGIAARLRHALTVMAGAGARARLGPLTQLAIRAFIARYGVDMSEAARPHPGAYATFNDFFTRALLDGARPLATPQEADWICPVDGAISQFGAIAGDEIFQAKGRSYSTTALLAGDVELAARFAGGQFATLYLSPRDYHRVHMPCAGRLLRMTHVPGDLYSVNPATARRVPGLFARNERVICLFDTVRGPLVLVLVGATIVGSMATSWHGQVNPPRSGKVRHFDYSDERIALARGGEVGRFMLGSTVIMLWPADTIRFNAHWTPGGAVRMGQGMGMTAIQGNGAVVAMPADATTRSTDCS